MATMVEHAGRRVAGRYVIPLTLIPSESASKDEADAMLVGTSEGATLQVQVTTFIKGKGQLHHYTEVVAHFPRGFTETMIAEDGSGPSRPYPCHFNPVRVWKDISARGVPHPVLGSIEVFVRPALRPGTRKFEGDFDD